MFKEPIDKKTAKKIVENLRKDKNPKTYEPEILEIESDLERFVTSRKLKSLNLLPELYKFYKEEFGREGSYILNNGKAVKLPESINDSISFYHLLYELLYFKYYKDKKDHHRYNDLREKLKEVGKKTNLTHTNSIRRANRLMVKIDKSKEVEIPVSVLNFEINKAVMILLEKEKKKLKLTNEKSIKEAYKEMKDTDKKSFIKDIPTIQNVVDFVTDEALDSGVDSLCPQYFITNKQKDKKYKGKNPNETKLIRDIRYRVRANMNIAKGYGLQYRKHKLLDKLKIKVLEFGNKDKFTYQHSYMLSKRLQYPSDEEKNSFSNWASEFEKRMGMSISEEEVRKSIAKEYLKGSA